MLPRHALQLQSSHVMILGHKYYMAISQSTHCHDPGTHTLQSTHVTILEHILQGNYSDIHITRQLQSTHGMILGHITRQLQWHTYYKATTVNPCHDPGTHAFQGNYSHSCKPLIHWLDSDLLAVRSPALSACRSLACTSCDVKGTSMPMPPDSVV